MVTFEKNGIIEGGQSRVRAVEYIRYSDHAQDDGNSIEYQTETCDKFIADKGWIKANMYVDAAKTGRTTATRDNFLRMLQDAKRGEFDVIVVYKFSRIFRNTYEAHLYEHEFSKYGVRLVSATEPIDAETIEGKLMKGIIHVFNEFTSDTIASHVTSSMITAVQKGVRVGGGTPLGYKLVPINPANPSEGNTLAINEEEAKIVRFVFDMWANGFSHAQITRACNAHGYTTRQGKPIGMSRTNAMLRNDTYIGTYRYKPKRFDEIVMENNHPPIIDKKTWDLVQYRLKNPTNHYPKPRMKGKRIYPLTGKIVCACCGNGLFGQTKNRTSKDTGETKVYSYYTCAGKKQQMICKLRDVRKDKLEEFVFNNIKKHILNGEAVYKIAQEVFSITGKQVTERADVVSLYKAKEKELTGMINEAFEMRLSTKNETAKAMLDKKVNELSNELDSVQAQLAKFDLMDDGSLTVQKIEDYLNELLSHIHSGDPALLKIVADNLVDKIIVSEEDIEVKLIVLLNPFIRDNETIGKPTWSLSLNINPAELREKGGRKRKPKG